MMSCGIVALLAFGLATESSAQVRRSFDAGNYFKSLDRNGDQKLDENELNPRAMAYLKKIGVDTGDDQISLRAIEKRIDQNKETAAEQAAQQSKRNPGKPLKVPGFGVPTGEHSAIPRFGSGEAGSSEETFSESTILQVERILRRYDRNGDNMIDMQERKDARWGRPDPSESDLNGDGVLSRNELMRRYHTREQEQAKQRTASRSDRSSTSRREGSRRSNGGDRNSNSNSRTGGRAATTTASSSSTAKRDSAAYEKYAKSLIKRYDKDRDNRLNKVEWKSVKRPPADADQNRDGYITEKEYANALQAAADKRSGSSRSSNTSAVKASANVKASSGSKAKKSANVSKSNRNSKSGGGDLSKLDKDSDNQVQMHEYSSDWDDKKLKEFYKIDKNRDGVITKSEWKAQ